jgi:hypothetical protein
VTENRSVGGSIPSLGTTAFSATVLRLSSERVLPRVLPCSVLGSFVGGFGVKAGAAGD